jgi:hypothetical protein
MKLTYRTISYELNQPPIDMVESELGGKYRGNAWQVHYPRHIPVPVANSHLKYRGVAYCSEDVRSVESNGIMNVSPEIQPQTPKREPTPENIMAVHTTNICRILERRRQAAQARGDERLLKLLELEARQLVC